MFLKTLYGLKFQFMINKDINKIYIFLLPNTFLDTNVIGVLQKLARHVNSYFHALEVITMIDITK